MVTASAVCLIKRAAPTCLRVRLLACCLRLCWSLCTCVACDDSSPLPSSTRLLRDNARSVKIVTGNMRWNANKHRSSMSATEIRCSTTPVM